MPETDFADFQLIPDAAPTLTPEQEAALYADPDAIQLPVADDQDDASPVGRSMWIDWDGGAARGDRWVDGVDAVVQVARCALAVTRGYNPLFPEWFGRSSVDAILGAVDDVERRAVHQADVRDTLLSCHERITGVTGFEWIYDESSTGIDLYADVEIDGQVTVRIGGAVA